MEEQFAANRGTDNECPMEIEIDAVPVVFAPVEGAFSNSYAREDCFGAKEALA